MRAAIFMLVLSVACMAWAAKEAPEKQISPEAGQELLEGQEQRYYGHRYGGGGYRHRHGFGGGYYGNRYGGGYYGNRFGGGYYGNRYGGYGFGGGYGNRYGGFYG